MEPPFSLVVFDLDGTLVDSARDIADSVNALLAEFDAPGLPEKTVAAMVGDGAKQLVERALVASGVATDATDIDAALARFLVLYDERLVVHTRPYDGAVDVLTELSGRDIRLAVLTNKPQRAAEHVLAALDLTRWFDVGVIGADAAYPRKPNPAGLVALAEAAGVPPSRTLMVGDARQDIETARNAGAAACVARYGFGFAAAEAVLDGSEIVIDSLAALPTHL